MIIERLEENPVEITDFEAQISEELIVTELRGRLYVARFRNCEIKYGIMLGSADGQSATTIDQALISLCEQLTYRKLIFRPTREDRKEVTAPMLVHTKLLNE